MNTFSIVTVVAIYVISGLQLIHTQRRYGPVANHLHYGPVPPKYNPPAKPITKPPLPTILTTKEPNITHEIISFSKNFSLVRRTLDQNLNIIDGFMDGGSLLTFRSAQTTDNATDSIIDQLDRATINESKYKTHELIIKQHIIVQTFQLSATNLAGLALYKGTNSKLRIEEIYINSSLTAIIQTDGFLGGVYIPSVLRDQILSTKNLLDPVVVVTVFLKDVLFVESDITLGTEKNQGIVFGVLIPDFHEKFRVPIKIIYKVNENYTSSKGCAYWLYGTQIKGSWKRETSATFCAGVEICEYYHVTHFGMLISNSDDDSRKHEGILNIITFAGCLLSIFGIFGIILTAILFKQWRSNKGNIILTNYATATLLEIVLLYSSGRAKENSVCDVYWCYWAGILLHYIVLAQFFWVLVISYLQYKRYVEIFGDITTNLILKSCLVGWAAPLVIVIPVSIAFSNSYVNSVTSLCYPSDAALYLGVLLPILIIVGINIFIFVLIIRNLFGNAKVRSTRIKNQTLLKFRLLLLLFFQLGISWVFGYLGFLHIALVYIFCLTTTLQGFFVFLLFIIFNQQTRMMYVKLLGRSKIEDKSSTAKYTSNTSTTGEVTVTESK